MCLNGHEYAKRQLARERIAFRPSTTAFSAAPSPSLQAICDGLSAEKIDALLHK
jgi:hypothetical protein